MRIAKWNAIIMTGRAKYPEHAAKSVCVLGYMLLLCSLA